MDGMIGGNGRWISKSSETIRACEAATWPYNFVVSETYKTWPQFDASIWKIRLSRRRPWRGSPSTAPASAQPRSGSRFPDPQRRVRVAWAVSPKKTILRIMRRPWNPKSQWNPKTRKEDKTRVLRMGTELLLELIQMRSIAPSVTRLCFIPFTRLDLSCNYLILFNF